MTASEMMSGDPGFMETGSAEVWRAPAPDAPEAPPDLADQIGQALADDDVARAFELYGSVGSVDPGIPPAQHFTVGYLAAKQRKFDLAIPALRAAAFAEHENAGRALVALAQIYGDVMNELASARALYREALRRYPGTDVAHFAQGRLGRL
jgi:TolA-binding protein